MHDAFEQFHGFAGRHRQQGTAGQGKLQMPVLALEESAEKSFGPGMAVELKFAAANVTGRIVPASGHWIMEENPAATTRLVLDFLAK